MRRVDLENQSIQLQNFAENLLNIISYEYPLSILYFCFGVILLMIIIIIENYED
mgnify:CR=1 FL=1